MITVISKIKNLKKSTISQELFHFQAIKSISEIIISHISHKIIKNKHDAVSKRRITGLLISLKIAILIDIQTFRLFYTTNIF